MTWRVITTPPLIRLLSAKVKVKEYLMAQIGPGIAPSSLPITPR